MKDEIVLINYMVDKPFFFFNFFISFIPIWIPVYFYVTGKINSFLTVTMIVFILLARSFVYTIPFNLNPFAKFFSIIFLYFVISILSMGGLFVITLLSIIYFYSLNLFLVSYFLFFIAILFVLTMFLKKEILSLLDWLFINIVWIVVLKTTNVLLISVLILIYLISAIKIYKRKVEFAI